MYNALRHGLNICLREMKQPGKMFCLTAINKGKISPAFSRTLHHMCSTSMVKDDFLKPKPLSECCKCGCSGLLHTGGEKDLVEFLQTEIAEEKKTLKMPSLPSEVDGFSISTDKAELVFTKASQLETITITMNVNHSVDTEELVDGSFTEEMKAKPSFDIDIKRKNKTLSFACSFIQLDAGGNDPDADLFEITEVTYFEGDWEDKTYSVAADILDENLYDLFMTILHEKGITRSFVERVSEVATSYEHSQYIGLLENVKKFSSIN